MRHTQTMPLRRWWRARVARLAEHWEEDVAFRHTFSFFVAALTLVLVALCLLMGVLIAHGIAPGLWGNAGGGADPHVNHSGVATFPVPPLRPNAPPPNVAPVAIATSAQGPLAQPTATPTPSPSPTLSPTAVLSPTPACPPAAPAPSLPAGRAVQDATMPTPLQGDCPAVLVISAALHPNAPIVVSLTFGTLNPIGCTLALNGTTDGNGNVTLPFTVPGTRCFGGSINTSGTVNVGGDTSANAAFAAQA